MVAYLFVVLNSVQIGPFQPSKGEKAKLKVKVRLNIHGIVSLESATVNCTATSCQIRLEKHITSL